MAQGKKPAMWNPDGSGWRAMPIELAAKFKAKAMKTKNVAIIGVVCATLVIKLVGSF